MVVKCIIVILSVCVFGSCLYQLKYIDRNDRTETNWNLVEEKEKKEETKDKNK
jgi:hypothetical protein